jgi:hypothetical protein
VVAQSRWVVWKDSRLDRIRHGVQHVLYLARLRPQLVQRTRVVPRVIGSPSIAERALIAKVVTGGATYLRHGCGGR